MMMQKKQTSAPQDSKRQPREEIHLEGLASIISMLIIWSFVMGFVFQNFVIPSSSMASTLLVGDHVIVERATLAPASTWTNLIPYRELRRDEPVVFFRPAPNPKGQHDILVKRVIGIPGDRIHLRGGIVYRNGVSLDEPYAAKPTPVNYDPTTTNSPLSHQQEDAKSPPSGRLTSSTTSRVKISSFHPACTSSWATTVPTATTAATGAWSPEPTSSAVHFSSTGLSKHPKTICRKLPRQKEPVPRSTPCSTSLTRPAGAGPSTG